MIKGIPKISPFCLKLKRTEIVYQFKRYSRFDSQIIVCKRFCNQRDNRANLTHCLPVTRGDEFPYFRNQVGWTEFGIGVSQGHSSPRCETRKSLEKQTILYFDQLVFPFRLSRINFL